MNAEHIAPDDYTFGMMPAPCQPPASTQSSRVDGFFSDAHLRRWCVEQVSKSRAGFGQVPSSCVGGGMAHEAERLYGFMCDSIPSHP